MSWIMVVRNTEGEEVVLGEKTGETKRNERFALAHAREDWGFRAPDVYRVFRVGERVTFEVRDLSVGIFNGKARAAWY